MSSCGPSDGGNEFQGELASLSDAGAVDDKALPTASYQAESRENAFVRTAGSPTSTGNVWLGGTDSIMEGVWRWQNGGPSDGSPQEDCTEMREGGTWNDVTCDRLNKFVCEQP